jgi:hypothetical protein
MKIALTLSTISLACILSACGGGGDEDSTVSPGTPGVKNDFVGQCFTANQTTGYNGRITVSPNPGNISITAKFTVGPMVYNGEKVTGSSGKVSFSAQGSVYYEFTGTDYWKITNNGVKLLGSVTNQSGMGSSEESRSFFDANAVYPVDMKAGQSFEYMETEKNMSIGVVDNIRRRVTLVGVEPVFSVDTPAGKKTFTNVCHFSMRNMNASNDLEEQWIAPGYIILKDVSTSDGDTMTFLYSGN